MCDLRTSSSHSVALKKQGRAWLHLKHYLAGDSRAPELKVRPGGNADKAYCLQNAEPLNIAKGNTRC